MCVGGERLVVESYKAFVRRRIPSKFFDLSQVPLPAAVQLIRAALPVAFATSVAAVVLVASKIA